MNRIPIPEISYAEKEVTLNGKTFFFTYRYSERQKFYHLDISDQDRALLKAGIALNDVGGLTNHFTELNKVLGGFLFIVKQKSTDETCGRNNIGVGKDYELNYISYKESDAGLV